jgi:tRNA nucleotidyltransferase (CCA-adding enzyme)
VEARDHVRNLQPVITGEHIMQYFDIRPGKDIGLIKNAIKEAILEGRISNDWEPGFKLMVESAASLGYTLKEKPI